MQDHSSALSTSELKKRIVKSFLSLATGEAILSAINFFSINIILARVLPVDIIGIFNIATSIVTFFTFFSDVGLAASLIQKKDATEDDIKTTFTIQQLLVASFSILIILAAPQLGHFYGLNDAGVWLVRILGFQFFISSLKVIPSVMLERQLKFTPLVVVDIVETAIFNVALMILIYKGYGIWGYSIATLARALAGVMLIYILSPVAIGFRLSRTSAKELLSFGVPYQLNSVLALVKDRLVPLVIARIVGPTGVGYISWAQTIAYLPLTVMNMVIRVTFPAFSRLQRDERLLGLAIEKSLFATTLAVYPGLFGLAAIFPFIIKYVVTAKWQPTSLSFYLFCFSTFWAVISTTFTNALNAVGHIQTTLKLMVFWTVITWVLSPLLTLIYGFNGVALSSFIISFTSIITVVIIKRIVKVRVLSAITLPTVASALMGVVVYFFSYYVVRDRLTLIVAVLVGGLIYLGLLFLLGGKKLLSELEQLRHG